MAIICQLLTIRLQTPISQYSPSCVPTINFDAGDTHCGSEGGDLVAESKSFAYIWCNNSCNFIGISHATQSYITLGNKSLK